MSRTTKIIIDRINEFVATPAYIFAVGAFTLIMHMLAWDLAGVIFICLAIAFSAYFLEDYRGWVTPFANLIFVVSTQNSPGYGDADNYYGRPEILYPILVAGVIAFSGIIYRVVKERKHLKDGKMYIPFAVMSVTMLLAGAGKKYYLDSVIASLIVIACLFGFYILFTATVKNDGHLFEYLSTLLAELALVAAIEVAFVYVLNYASGGSFGTIVGDDGKKVEWKMRIITGWGVSNIAGEIIAMFLPFAYFKAERGKCAEFYWISALFSSAMIILTLSRTGMAVGGVIAIYFVIRTLVKRKEKRVSFGIILAVFLAVAAAGAAVVVTKLDFSVIDYLKNAFTSGDASNGRAKLWKYRIEYFLESPIIGVGFARRFMDSGAVGFYYSEYAHNYVLDAMGSAGVMGLLAMVAVLYYMFRLYLKKNEGRLYTLVFFLANLAIGLMDVSYCMPYVLYFFALVTVATEKISLPQEIYEKN